MYEHNDALLLFRLLFYLRKASGAAFGQNKTGTFVVHIMLCTGRTSAVGSRATECPRSTFACAQSVRAHLGRKPNRHISFQRKYRTKRTCHVRYANLVMSDTKTNYTYVNVLRIQCRKTYTASLHYASTTTARCSTCVAFDDVQFETRMVSADVYSVHEFSMISTS